MSAILDFTRPSPAGTSDRHDWQHVFNAMVHPRRVPMDDQESLHLYHAHAGVLPFEGESLSTWHWGIQGPRVLLIHGWESRSTHWHAWVPALLAAGFRVSALDLPAHGHSSGASTDVVQCGRAVLAFARQLGSVHGVVAHSMGSAATLHAFAHGLEVQASVHLAGPSSVRRVLQGVARAGRLDDGGTQALIQAFEQRTGQPVDDMEAAALASGMKHPALLCHDPADAEVPLHESRVLAAHWPLARLLETPGTGHRRILRDAEVIQAGVQALRPLGASR
ncbi:MAG: alpha/beta hydrolase [Aquabacterium sp.]